MRFSRGTLIPVAVVALSLVSADGVAAKCFGDIRMPGYEYVPGGLVVVPLVDGSILTVEEMDEVDPYSIRSREVTCWNPETGKFGGVGVPVVLIRTKDFVESTIAPIEGHLRGLHARVLRDFYRMATTTKGGEDEPLSH